MSNSPSPRKKSTVRHTRAIARVLRDVEGTPLAGRMLALLDVVSRLPHKILFEEDSHAHDQSFWEAIVDALLERQRVRKDIDEDTITGLVNVFGSYLGAHFVKRCCGLYDGATYP